MTIEERVKKANELHHRGYNCAQAVAGAYSDAVELDEKTLMKVSEGFGAGMGGLQETCGAVTGMVMLAGLKNSAGDVEEKMTKAATFAKVRELAAEFKNQNTTMNCRELKGVDTGKVLRSCDDCIADAVRIAGRKLFELPQ